LQFYYWWSEVEPWTQNIPLSYVVAGEQRIAGFPSVDAGGWYDGVWGWERFVAERARYTMDDDTAVRISMDGMFADGSGNRLDPGGYLFDSHFESVSERWGWRSEGSVHVRSGGDWDFFPIQVRYERYAFDDQPDQPEWTVFVKDTIAGYEPLYWQEILLADAPIVFTDAWFFTWDGLEMTVVNASNMADRGRTRDIDRSNFSPNPPPAEDTVIYHVSVLFIEGREPHVFVNSVLTGPIHQPMDDAPVPFGSWLPSESSEWFWEEVQWFDVVQYDENGNWMVCPMFYAGGHDFIPAVVTAMLIDIDGCGDPELVIHTPGNSRGLIQIFKFADGQLEAVYQNLTPW
jgi:hypothetical protein